MHYASIKTCDVANGTGVRVSLFVSGCRHHCVGCFNQEAWDFNYGNPFTQQQQKSILEALQPDYISGLSLLGGEPLDPSNVSVVLKLVQSVKQALPEKTIWCYTGYRWEDELVSRIQQEQELKALLALMDVLVEGRFELSLKQLGLKFRGSTNQRILDLPQSMQTQQPVILSGIE